MLLLALVAAGCDKNKVPSTTPTAPEEPAVPKAVVQEREATLDAGEVDFGKPMEFPFHVHNAGKAPLTMTFVRRSCDCTEVTLPGDVPPGSDGEVVIHWKPHPASVPNFTLSAELATNDPKQPTLQLRVTAHVNSKVRLFPGDVGYVDFGDTPILPGQVKEREVTVYSTELPSFQVLASTSHPGFEVVSPGGAPLPKNAMVGGSEATCGYKVTVRTTDKLPLGAVQAQLSLLVKVPGEADRTVTMPIYAVVDPSGVVTVKPQTLLFNKPHLTEADFKKVHLEFLSPPKDEAVEVVRTEPAFLKVDKPVRQRPGSWEVTVRIPPDDPEAAKYQLDHFMDGQVVLKAAGAQAELAVRVKWNPDEK
jgi:hypothetical protein